MSQNGSSNNPTIDPESPPESHEASAPGSDGAQPELSPEQQRLAELENELKEKDNKYLYLYAEFDNFKKRTAKERSELIKFGWEPVARELLGVLENLELALAHMPESTDKNLRQGLEMVLEQFKSTLKKKGVEPVETAGQIFDPNLHEAMAQEVSDRPPGSVIKVLSTGYTLHGRLLKPARVVVGTEKN